MTNFRYRIFHPHNPEVVEALLDRVEIITNQEFIQRVMLKIFQKKYAHTSKSHYPSYTISTLASDVILMSSDAGGFKPLMKLADAINWKGETASASKSRKYEDGKSKLTQLLDREDYGGKDILIIDDICVRGGTFKGLSKLLREKNVGKLYLATSHFTVRDLGDDDVTNYFDHVFTTNSKYGTYHIPKMLSGNVEALDKLTVINIFK